MDAILSLTNENKADFVFNTDSYTKNLHLYHYYYYHYYHNYYYYYYHYYHNYYYYYY